MNQTKNNLTQRHLILEKSSILFWKKGYAETSMKDIASACGFRPANIYNYFDKKETILFEILRDEMEELLAPIRPLKNNPDIDPVEAVKMMVENHIKLTLGEKRSSVLLFDVGLNSLSKENKKKIIKLRDEYDDISVTILKRGMDKNIFRKTDPKMVVFAVASVIARSRIWYSPKGRYSIDEIVDFISSLFLKGIEKER